MVANLAVAKVAVAARLITASQDETILVRVAAVKNLNIAALININN
jgi:hypothetical protein